MTRFVVLITLFSTVFIGCLSFDDDIDPTATPASTATATVAASAVSSTATTAAGSPLDGTSWRLIELVGESVDPSFGPTLIFEEGRVSGDGGCNEFFASYTTNEGGGLSITGFGSTEVLCPEPFNLMEFESRYFDALKSSVRYFLDPPRLALHGANDDTLLLFEPLEASAQLTPPSPPVSAEPTPTPTTPIADYGNWEIYVMGADGSNQHRPVPSLAGESWPEWMHDGRLSFQSSRTGEQRVFAVQPDGENLEELPINLDGVTSSVQWSADGSQIFYASNIDSLEQLYVADADGSHARRITEIASGTSMPAWSPDGTQAVFMNWSHGPSQLYRVNTDGTGLERLTFEQEASDDSPAWSPDGAKIAFSRTPNDGLTSIYIMNSDGSDIRLLVENAYGPAWSPDGTRIAYSWRQDIWVIDIDGSDRLRLTDNPHSDSSPVWSPDGTQIAFISNRDGGQPINCTFSTIVDYVWMESLDQLAWMSEQIVVAEVVEQFPSAFGPVEDVGSIEQTYPIFTDYLLEVDTWIRGVPSSTLRLRRPGGTVGDCVQTYEGEPEIEIGSRILLFLLTDELNPNLPPASIMLVGEQAFWPVGDDGAVENERFPDYDGIEVDDLAATIRDTLRQPEPDYHDLVPLEESPIVEAR